MLVGYLSPYMSPSCLGRRAPGMGMTHFVRAFRDWQRVGCLRVDFSEHLWKNPSETFTEITFLSQKSIFLLICS